MAQTITNTTVEEIAHLARLEFNETARAEIQNDLNRMLGFIEKLNEINTDGVEPLIYMTEERNVLRADEPGEMVSQEEALKNAPRRDSDYFKVPKVINQNR
jgi:aspartyl-tRNA(Asn)/glutamyl-tRNA(Gln) amidotransferase subunit C